jgi:hypothetical protein
MGIAKKYNKQGNRFDYQIPEGNDHAFIKTSELFNLPQNSAGVVVRSMYINSKGKYGDHGVIICSDPAILIDCPNHMTETIRDIIKDDEAVEQVNAGKLGVRAYEYATKNAASGKAYGLEFIDL